jgi:4-amino-4-deoxy-L-arabinose transferase-like glycosyltransferase
MSRSHAVALAVFALTALALLPDLGGQYVWSKDEARPALIARDMVERGHWLIPHIGDRIDATKPPLLSWLVALLSPRGDRALAASAPAGGAEPPTTISSARRGQRWPPNRDERSRSR